MNEMPSAKRNLFFGMVDMAGMSRRLLILSAALLMLSCGVLSTETASAQIFKRAGCQGGCDSDCGCAQSNCGQPDCGCQSCDQSCGQCRERSCRLRNCRRCPKCQNDCCQLEAKPEEQERSCFKVEQKLICIPTVRLPWQKCCPSTSKTRTINVLKTHTYKCPGCDYVWTVHEPELTHPNYDGETAPHYHPNEQPYSDGHYGQHPGTVSSAGPYQNYVEGQGYQEFPTPVGSEHRMPDPVQPGNNLLQPAGQTMPGVPQPPLEQSFYPELGTGTGG